MDKTDQVMLELLTIARDRSKNKHPLQRVAEHIDEQVDKYVRLQGRMRENLQLIERYKQGDKEAGRVLRDRGLVGKSK